MRTFRKFGNRQVARMGCIERQQSVVSITFRVAKLLRLCVIARSVLDLCVGAPIRVRAMNSHSRSQLHAKTHAQGADRRERQIAAAASWPDLKSRNSFRYRDRALTSARACPSCGEACKCLGRMRAGAGSGTRVCSIKKRASMAAAVSSSHCSSKVSISFFRFDA